MAGAPGNRRVVRGGSFNNTADNARCAYRNNRNPSNRNRNNGFRVGVGVVAAHFSPYSAAPNSQKGSEAAPPEMSPGYGIVLSIVEGLGDRGCVFCISKTRERKRGGHNVTMPLAAVAGLRARRLGRITTVPGP
jgi:hypothetical protein